MRTEVLSFVQAKIYHWWVLSILFSECWTNIVLQSLESSYISDKTSSLSVRYKTPSPCVGGAREEGLKEPLLWLLVAKNVTFT